VHGNLGAVDENNYEDVLTDDVDVKEPNTPSEQIEAPLEPERVEILPPGPKTGIPENTETIGEYENGQQLVYDGIDNKNVIVFRYITRKGVDAGVRTVEPHYAFIAGTTGNEVLVSWDRSVNDIRSFIIGNINPIALYPFVHFKPKGAIMVG